MQILYPSYPVQSRHSFIQIAGLDNGFMNFLFLLLIYFNSLHQLANPVGLDGGIYRGLWRIGLRNPNIMRTRIIAEYLLVYNRPIVDIYSGLNNCGLFGDQTATVQLYTIIVTIDPILLYCTDLTVYIYFILLAQYSILVNR